MKASVSSAEWQRQARRDREERGWVAFARFLMLLVFVVLVFELGQSMVHHHFFSGGALNYGNHPGGP